MVVKKLHKENNLVNKFSNVLFQSKLVRVREISNARIPCVYVCTLTWCAATGDLHIKLDCVHAQYRVANVTQHVRAGGHTHERRQLQQLLQLQLPPEDKYVQSFTHTNASNKDTNKSIVNGVYVEQ